MDYKELFKKASKLNVYDWFTIINSTTFFNADEKSMTLSVDLEQHEIRVSFIDNIRINIMVNDGIHFYEENEEDFFEQRCYVHEIVIELYRYLKIEF